MFIRGFCFFVSTGLRNLQSINLSFTLVTDIGMKKISMLSALKSVNLDNRQITDVGLAALTSMYHAGTDCALSLFDSIIQFVVYFYLLVSKTVAQV